MFTAPFWKAATERAIKTAAQTAILTIGADTFNVVTLDWAEVAYGRARSAENMEPAAPLFPRVDEPTLAA